MYSTLCYPGGQYFTSQVATELLAVPIGPRAQTLQVLSQPAVSIPNPWQVLNLEQNANKFADVINIALAGEKNHKRQ